MDNKPDKLLEVNTPQSKSGGRDRKLSEVRGSERILAVQVHPLQPHVVAVISTRGLTVYAAGALCVPECAMTLSGDVSERGDLASTSARPRPIRPLWPSADAGAGAELRAWRVLWGQRRLAPPHLPAELRHAH